MTIEDKAYVTYNYRRNSFLIYEDTVDSIEKCNTIAVSTNFNDYIKYIDELKTYRTTYPDKKIILDCSTEIFPMDVLRYLVENNFSNIEIYTNSITEIFYDKSKIKIHVTPFFLEYSYRYTPISTFKTLPKKSFLLLTGKPKLERTALVAKLHSKELLKHGYVSYFGINPPNIWIKKSLDARDTNFKLLSESLQKDVGYMFEELDNNLTIDTLSFDYGTAHSREYNSDYYNNVDFVIVCETDFVYKKYFFTEKTSKAIQMDKKFILMYTQGSLQELKNIYLKKFNTDISHLTDWVDTSYDDCSTPWERIEKITEIVKQQVKKKHISSII
jgi:hypothetical protein